MSRTKPLSKEQKTALMVLLENMNKIDFNSLLPPNFQKSSSMLPTNYVASSYQAFQIANLPKQKYWSWNQSNAKVTLFLQDLPGRVTLRKVCPRNRGGVPLGNEVPSLKIWLYEIELLPSGEEMFFLWCEKGVENRDNEFGVPTEIGWVYPAEISVASLSFLSPFVDNELAKELGWLC